MGGRKDNAKVETRIAKQEDKETKTLESRIEELTAKVRRNNWEGQNTSNRIDAFQFRVSTFAIKKELLWELLQTTPFSPLP
jgi:hypothetical protein